MGQGGFITLVNGTNYNWTRKNQKSYQMNSWNFPNSIPAGQTAHVYLEWNQGVFSKTSDDSGDVTYGIDGASHSFDVHARATHGFNLSVVLSNLATSGSPQGSTIDLGWKHDGSVPFVLAGTVGNFSSNIMPTGWMEANMGTLGNRTLRQLCIPGSHDAGMSVCEHATAFASRCNVQTQTRSILEQLDAGSRYFDIRPIIGGGDFFTGHYSWVGAASSWQGARGQSIDSIIADVNRYTTWNKDLVILYLSHDLNTDAGAQSYRPFTQEEWNRLLEKLSGLQNLHTVADIRSLDLTTLPLKQFIDGKPAVLVIVDPSGGGISLGNHAGKGFFPASCFPVYDRYSETNTLNTMVNDQLTKMKQQRPNPSQSYFLLSWTLTQSDAQATLCSTGTVSSILDLAAEADPEIYQMLLPACSAQTYPNILYIDKYDTGAMAALAMAVNTKGQP